MIAVLLERQGLQDHSYSIHGEIAESLALWRILKEPALVFLHRLKREYPELDFEARIQLVCSDGNESFLPELTFTILSSNCLDLAQSLLQQFVETHACRVASHMRRMRIMRWEDIE